MDNIKAKLNVKVRLIIHVKFTLHVRFIIELILFTSIIIPGILCTCDTDWEEYQGKCYMVSARDHNVTFDEAKDECEGKNAMLASIASHNESEHLRQL